MFPCVRIDDDDDGDDDDEMYNFLKRCLIHCDTLTQGSDSYVCIEIFCRLIADLKAGDPPWLSIQIDKLQYMFTRKQNDVYVKTD